MSDNQDNLAKALCCKYCKHYIEEPRVKLSDGYIGSICIVDRIENVYIINNRLNLGDREQHPDHICARFEFKRPIIMIYTKPDYMRRNKEYPNPFISQNRNTI